MCIRDSIYRNHDILWKITSEKNIIYTISSILSSPKNCLHSAFISHWRGGSFYFISMVFLLFRRRRRPLEMFLEAESDGSRLFRSLTNKIQTIIYKIECSLLVLVDRLKRCRDFPLAKPRSDQWYGFRSGKCHSFFKIQIKTSRLKAFREHS